MIRRDLITDLDTHEVRNPPPPFADQNLFLKGLPLREALAIRWHARGADSGDLEHQPSPGNWQKLAEHATMQAVFADLAMDICRALHANRKALTRFERS